MIPFDRFAEAFLTKISDYNLAMLEGYQQRELVDRFLHTACANFARLCKYALTDDVLDDETRTLMTDIPANHIGEIVDIVSIGMIVAWMNTYLYRQENLQNVLNTTDFYGYSPAELLKQIRMVHKQASVDFTTAMRRYSFDNADRRDFVV